MRESKYQIISLFQRKVKFIICNHSTHGNSAGEDNMLFLSKIHYSRAIGQCMLQLYSIAINIMSRRVKDLGKSILLAFGLLYAENIWIFSFHICHGGASFLKDTEQAKITPITIATTVTINCHRHHGCHRPHHHHHHHHHLFIYLCIDLQTAVAVSLSHYHSS